MHYNHDACMHCSNFSMDEQHAPIARPNTAVVFATNNNNHKRVCIKFYAPRSPGYRAETSAYYRLASRHLPFLESTFTDKDGSYASALVMEAGDRSLRELLAERRPTDLPRKVCVCGARMRLPMGHVCVLSCCCNPECHNACRWSCCTSWCSMCELCTSTTLCTANCIPATSCSTPTASRGS